MNCVRTCAYGRGYGLRCRYDLHCMSFTLKIRKHNQKKNWPRHKLDICTYIGITKPYPRLYACTHTYVQTYMYVCRFCMHVCKWNAKLNKDWRRCCCWLTKTSKAKSCWLQTVFSFQFSSLHRYSHAMDTARRWRGLGVEGPNTMQLGQVWRQQQQREPSQPKFGNDQVQQQSAVTAHETETDLPKCHIVARHASSSSFFLAGLLVVQFYLCLSSSKLLSLVQYNCCFRNVPSLLLFWCTIVANIQIYFWDLCKPLASRGFPNFYEFYWMLFNSTMKYTKNNTLQCWKTLVVCVTLLIFSSAFSNCATFSYCVEECSVLRLRYWPDFFALTVSRFCFLSLLN